MPGSKSGNSIESLSLMERTAWSSTKATISFRETLPGLSATSGVVTRRYSNAPKNDCHRPPLQLISLEGYGQRVPPAERFLVHGNLRRRRRDWLLAFRLQRFV